MPQGCWYLSPLKAGAQVDPRDSSALGNSDRDLREQRPLIPTKLLFHGAKCQTFECLKKRAHLGIFIYLWFTFHICNSKKLKCEGVLLNLWIT